MHKAKIPKERLDARPALIRRHLHAQNAKEMCKKKEGSKKGRGKKQNRKRLTISATFDAVLKHVGKLSLWM